MFRFFFCIFIILGIPSICIINEGICMCLKNMCVKSEKDIIISNVIESIKNLNKNKKNNFICVISNLTKLNNEHNYKEEDINKFYDVFEDSVGVKICNINKNVVIFSDIHGEYRHLIKIFEYCIENKNDIDYIIDLGDNFDRGESSIYTLVVLKCMKEYFKKKFIMLSGNHEDTNLIKKYGFYDEILHEKIIYNYYTEELILQHLGTLFSTMQFNALLKFDNNKQVYLAHAAIPLHIYKEKVCKEKEESHDNLYKYDLDTYITGKRIFEKERSIDTSDEYQRYSIVWTDLNNDCTNTDQVSFNYDRNVGYCINKNVELKFMEKNSLDYVITGHRHINVVINYADGKKHLFLCSGRRPADGSDQKFILLNKDGFKHIKC